HHGKDADVPVSVDAAPMGITGDAPVHEWEVTIRDARQWDGQWGQPAIIEGYRKSRWAGESALIPAYHGTRAPEARLERTFSLVESQAKMWVMTQCPAIIWSLDSLPSQHRIPSTPGAGITGTYPDFTFNTEYAENEIAFIVPAGRRVAALTVNGEKSGFRYGRDGNALLAIVNIAGAGKHNISVKLADTAAADHQSLAVTAKVEGSRLSGRVTGNGSDSVTVSIYNEGALCFTDTVGADGTFAVDLPATTRDGSYRIAVADLTGKRIAKTALAIRGLAKPTALMVEMPHIHPEIAVKDAVKGIYRRQGTEFTPDASYAEADAASGQLRVGTLPAIATYYSTAIAGLEMKAKRYLEIELSSNLDYYNKYGQEPKRHFVRIDCPETSAALMFDFHTRDGYTRRTLAGLGQQYLERGTSPAKWGKGSKPDAFYALTNYIQSADGSNVRFWLDAEALEAPADWDGQLWVSLLFQIGAPNRQLNARILRTADKLPAGAECLKPVSLQAKVERQEFRVQQFPSGTKV
ncbi:MAG: hypothetical protein J6S21_04380, partial [Victivallales bacterium]|nr:hypothetical protein [Victivallales bacterium]